MVHPVQGISKLMCFEFVRPGEILARKSHGVGMGITLKSPKYQHSNIPVLDMVGIERAPFNSTEGARNNLFIPGNRERDSQVLTRDVSVFQMWLEFILSVKITYT